VWNGKYVIKHLESDGKHKYENMGNVRNGNGNKLTVYTYNVMRLRGEFKWHRLFSYFK
jgi:hypothetical protein